MGKKVLKIYIYSSYLYFEYCDRFFYFVYTRTYSWRNIYIKNTLFIDKRLSQINFEIKTKSNISLPINKNRITLCSSISQYIYKIIYYNDYCQLLMCSFRDNTVMFLMKFYHYNNRSKLRLFNTFSRIAIYKRDL